MYNCDLQLLEKIIIQQEQQFKQILNIINGHNGMICVLNPEGIYIQHSHIKSATQKKYEIPHNKLIGKSIYDLVIPEHKRIATYYLHCALSSIDADKFFIKNKTYSATGTINNELFYYGPLKDINGKIIGSISHMLDLKCLQQSLMPLLNFKTKNISNIIQDYFKNPFKELLLLANLLDLNTSNENNKVLINEMKNLLKTLLKQA